MITQFGKNPRNNAEVKKKDKRKEKGKGVGVKIGSHVWIEVDTNNYKKRIKFGIRSQFFFQLEQWTRLLLRHNPNVIHIKKNVCDSTIGTLLKIPGKTKDIFASRLYLVEIGVRLELAPQFSEKRTYLPTACYNLKKIGEASNM